MPLEKNFKKWPCSHNRGVHTVHNFVVTILVLDQREPRVIANKMENPSLTLRQHSDALIGFIGNDPMQGNPGVFRASFLGCSLSD